MTAKDKAPIVKLSPWRYRLVELLAGMISDKRQPESGWGRVVGKEAW